MPLIGGLNSGVINALGCRQKRCIANYRHLCGHLITLFWISRNLLEAAFNSLMGFNGFNGCEGKWRAGCQNNQEKDGSEDNAGIHPAVNSSSAPTRSKIPDQSRASPTANLPSI